MFTKLATSLVHSVNSNKEVLMSRRSKTNKNFYHKPFQEIPGGTIFSYKGKPYAKFHPNIDGKFNAICLKKGSGEPHYIPDKSKVRILPFHKLFK